MSETALLDNDSANSDTEKANNEISYPTLSDDENDETKTKDTKVDTKKISKPRAKRPVLNTQLLKGPRGIHTIETYFIDFQFKGKGRERDDLNQVMKRLEHWAHRLFPKYDFEDALARMENLGVKRDLKVFMTKYRMDNMDNDGVGNKEDDENEPQNSENVPQNSENARDAFDEMMGNPVFPEPEPVFVAPQAARPVPALDEETKARIERNRQLALKKKEESLARRAAVAQVEAPEKESSQVQSAENQQNVLSEEEMMKARIEQNRQMALERKMAKMREREVLLQNHQDSGQDIEPGEAEKNVNTESTSMEVDSEAIEDLGNV